MIRKDLHQWQWSDYFSKHRNKVNLVIHIFAVPLFWAGTFKLATGMWSVGIGLIVIAIVLQGLGHKSEKEIPTPFDGPLDFVSRFLMEQFVTFPRFLFSGEWLRSLKDQ